MNKLGVFGPFASKCGFKVSGVGFGIVCFINLKLLISIPIRARIKVNRAGMAMMYLGIWVSANRLMAMRMEVLRKLFKNGSRPSEKPSTEMIWRLNFGM